MEMERSPAPLARRQVLRVMAVLSLVASLLVGGNATVTAATAPTFRSVATVDVDSTTVVVPVPAGVIAGDLLLAQITTDDGTVTITPPAGWTTIREDGFTSQIKQSLFYRFAGGSEPADYTFTISSTRKAAGAIAAYSGVDPTNPINAHSGQGLDTPDAFVAPSLTTTVANTTLVATFTNRSGAAVTPPGSMSERWDHFTGDTAAAEGADETLASVGATGTRTAGAQAVQKVAQMVALAPIAAPPGTVVVNSTRDLGDDNAGDGICDTGDTNSLLETECTLRAAIEEANAPGIIDTIHFDIPITETGYTASPVSFTIEPTSLLPLISTPMVLDASTQPEHGTAGRPVVEVDGTNVVAGEENGFHLTGGSATLRGFVINNFGDDAIDVEFNGGNFIVGNYIGTDVTGTAAKSNQWGINVKSSDNTIGGTDAADRNVVSGNTFDGLYIYTSGATGNTVLGNYIGTDASGMLSLANGGHGVYIHSGATGNTIGGIATDAGNRIASNGADGVYVANTASDNNTILGNRIYGNGGLGIDLATNGVTGNDSGDGDAGANDELNQPVMKATRSVAGTVNVDFSLDVPNGNYRVEFFSNPSGADPTTYGEGEIFASFIDVSVAGGVPTPAFHSFAGSVGDVITATATEGTAVPFGSTSEFSLASTAINGVLVVNSAGDASDNNLADGFCDTGGLVGLDAECTLRAATQQADASSGADVVEFSIPIGDPGHAAGVWTISTNGVLPIGTTISIDATTQTGYTVTPVVELEGSSAGAGADGLQIDGDNVIVRGLAINRFGGDGIKVGTTASGTSIVGNHIGLDATGLIDRGNVGRGIDLQTGSGPSTIGGTLDGDRNVVSGNGDDGLIIFESNDNTVIGNYFGTDVTGNAPMPNDADGIALSNTSSNNTIGQPGAGNVLSGNGNDGLELDDDLAGNVIQANIIGLGEDGDTLVPNGRHGVVLYNGVNTSQIGGTNLGEGNVISGNAVSGLIIDGFNNSATRDNRIEGNYIGIDATGQFDRGNASYGVHFFAGANNNTIGGASVSAGNVISGNGSGDAGVFITHFGSSGNVIQHNLIGTNTDGTLPIPNNLHGILLTQVPNTQILDNLISGNLVHGIYIFGAAAIGTQILRNSIGTNAATTAPLANGYDGVRLEGASTGTIIGSPTNGNTISGNSQHGVNANDSNGNTVQANYIGTNSGGTLDLGNTLSGVYSDAFNSSNNLIGGPNQPEANTIAFNGEGITMLSGNDNAILGNAVYANVGLGIDLGDDGVTFNDVTPGDGDSGPNDLLNFPVVTSAIEGGGTVTVEFDLDVPDGAYRVEFFVNPDGADPTTYGEGEDFVSSVDVSVTGGVPTPGSHAFAGAAGDVVTSTATEGLVVPFGSTSEFSMVTTVVASNNPPVANNDPVSGTFSVGESGIIVIDVMANDTDPDLDTLLLQSFTQPPVGEGSVTRSDGGTPADASDDRVRFLAPVEWDGATSFTYTISDGVATDVGTVFITVTEVNRPPVLQPVGSRTVDEQTLLSFTATASDPDTPANALTFSLVGEPAGAAITAGGGFTWTPTEAQGPGGYSFDVVVTDDGTGTLADSETITVTVDEVNRPPVLGSIGNRTVDEQTLLSFTATASDPDTPANNLTFSLVGEPSGAGINPITGLFDWTPTEAQGPGSYSFDVVVTDDGTGTLADSETIVVTVDEVNRPPVLDAVGNRTVDEQTLLSFTATASDPDTPANTLTFSLVGAPSGAAITAGGDFTWTPTEAQGPGSYSFDVVVTDDGVATLADSETIIVTVGEVNRPPVLGSIGNQTIDEQTLLAFTATASDPDTPANALTFSLVGEPAGAAITAGGGFTWTPTEAQGPGSYVFDVVVTDDGTGTLSDSETIMVTVDDVNRPPVLDAVGSRSVDEQMLLSFTATASDPDVPANTLTFSLSGAPAGAAITAGGDFTWTPTEAQGPGGYVFDVVVTDDGTGTLSDSETITVTVDEVNRPPVLGSIGDQTIDEQALLSFTATASDPDTPANTLTFSLSGAPAGAAITAGGDFTWTPTEAQGPGGYVFDVVVTDDGTGTLSDSETITVTVDEVNRPPVLGSIGNQTIDEQALLSFTATASDPDTPANNLTFSLVGEPSGAGINPISGLFDWTPTEAQGPGSYVFVVLVTDDGTGTLSDSETITVTVDEVNRPPVLDAVGNRTVDEQMLLSFTATASDPDVPANTLTFSLVGAPSGAAITAGGDFAWTPTEAQGPGSYVFDVVVTDDGAGMLTDSETITVTVGEGNRPPVLDLVGSHVINEQTLLSFTATATDPDTPANSLTFSLVGEPVGAAMTAGGDFTWTPTEAQGPGSYSFDVVVADDGTGTLSDSETIIVTVDEVNRPPVLDLVGNRTVDEQMLLSFTATASDPDVPANTLVFSLSGAPAGAAITAGGNFTWTPTEAQGPGTYSFDVVVTDDGAGLLADSESITVTVGELNRPPVLGAVGNRTVDEQILLSFTATASDPDTPGNTLVFSLSGAPAGAAITDGGNFTWSPTEAQGPGTYSFVVTVTDNGTGTLSDSETITVTVGEVNRPPVLDPVADQTIDEQSLLSFTATATDPDSPANSITFSLTGAPAGASITGGGDFSWTATEAQGPGSYTIVVVVTDGNGLSDSQSITVTVGETNTAPAVVDPGDQTTTIGDDVALTIAGSDVDEPSNDITWTARGLPPGLTLSTAGVVGGTPTVAGTYAVSITVTDDAALALSATTTFTWTIVAVTAANPVAVDDRYTANSDGLVIGSAPGVLANDSHPNGSQLSVELTVGPEFGSLTLRADGSFTYRHDGTDVATDSFIYTVTDGFGNQDTAIVTITIRSRNGAPQPVDDVFSLEAGATVVVDPLENDVDPDGDDLTITRVSDPFVGTLTVSRGGELTFSAPDDYSGEVIVRYTVTDEDGATATASVTFVVTGVNQPPVGAPDVVDLPNYALFSIRVLDNDRDPEGEALRVVSIDGDVAGRLELDGGQVLYQPEPGWVGTDLFTYVVSDPHGLTDTVTVAVSISLEVRTLSAAASDALGTGHVVFAAPATSDPFAAPESISLTQGVSLLADSFFQSLGALSLPLGFLGLAMTVALTLGGTSQIPAFMTARRRRYWSVVLLDRETILPVYDEPSYNAEAVYKFEPTAQGIRSVDSAKEFDGELWIEIETPNGNGWVERKHLSALVEFDDFVTDQRPAAVVRDLLALLEAGADLTPVVGPRGLAVAQTNRPVLVPYSEVVSLTGDTPAAVNFRNEVAQPLRAALLDLANISPQTRHSPSALIPVELWNFPYLAIQAPGHGAWLLYFEYIRGRPKLVGIGLDL